MAACTRLLKSSFPALDDELFTYINGVLEGGADEFSTSEDVFDAVGAVLLEVADESKDEKDIMEVCDQLLNLLKSNSNNCYSGHQKILDAPIHLGRMAEALEPKSEEVKSIWLAQKEVASKVDQRKLEKVEARLKGKLEKRGQQGSQESNSNFITKMATATQAISRKESRMEAKGINNSKDIHIENFDVAFGDRVLIRGADITLVFGHRYGFVGRNGLGKTTLLRMISSGQLRIPSHFRILHVEQEVVGDDTPALQSVLECDTVREELLQEEKSIYKKISEGNTEDPNLNERLTQIYTELQAMEADKAPAKASVILAGLGFSPAMQEQLTKEFSGGWRMRLALARALFSKPDLLLLDEPTNMLDMKAIIWLESYLQTWPTTLLVVSHDRHFLDVVPTDILLLHSQRIDSYKGNYENFIKVMTEKLKNQQREYEAQQQYRAHVQVFIDKFRYNAKRASLVQSKIKMLEKLPELQPVEKEQGVVLRFPDTENLSPPILQLQDVSFHYVEGKPIFSNINVSANMESRICIVGDNGAGKSTLLKLLLGDLSPIKGIKHVHRNLRIGYFSQHHVDQLDMNTSSVELLASRYPGKTAEEYRHQLGSFGISGDLALQQVASLSGGQKSRVAFALMCMNRPNFLILDEPTNHLDVETIEALGKAINKFTGGIMLVSHDERLIRAVCKELWICAKEQVRAIDGGFDEYRKQVEEELENQTKSR